MNQNNIFVDIEYCTGCRSCEVACKQENNIPAGIKWINVVTVGPRMIGGKLRMDFVPVKCRHCAKAPCIDACPEKAITKRSDGIVLINKELCIGCMTCAEACPFGVLQLNPQTQVAEKCTMCVQRIDNGLKPACVHHCPAQCIYFGEINQILITIQEKEARRTTESGVLSI